MNTNPDDVRLFPEQRKCIAELADALCLNWPDVLTAVFKSAKLGIVNYSHRINGIEKRDENFGDSESLE